MGNRGEALSLKWAVMGGLKYGILVLPWAMSFSPLFRRYILHFGWPSSWGAGQVLS